MSWYKPIEALAIVFLAIVAAIAWVAPAGPGRQIGLAMFLLIAPGLAVTTLAGIRDRLVHLLLVIPLSLAINATIAMALLYFGIWSPDLIFVVVAAVTFATAAVTPYERSARVALLLVALLPGVVLLAAELSVGAPA